ncbi:MAG: PAS domain-containing sensor histidine kinase [Candidatus Methanoperedens sp.]|nr:PAS domain-containing sensor histidine kinase [Candidatus Methanoperedens sp.]
MVIREKQEKDALLQEKNRLEDVTGYANCGMLLLDSQTRITYANSIAEKWFGPFHQMEGKFCWEIYKINEPEKECASLEVLQTGETAHRDVSMHLENGDQKFFYIVASPVKDNSGKIRQINEIVIDFTERKRIEENFRTLLESAPDAILTVNSSGNIVFANAQTEEMFGYNRGELFGKTYEILIPERFREVHVRHCVNFFSKPRSQQMCLGADKFGRRRDGTEFPMECSFSPVKTEEGILMMSIISDITERKKAEETRLENLRLEAADKAKGEFLANMSHELRTPLNSSIGFSELLTQGMAGELSEKQKHYVDNILASNQFLLTLINDILDLSKIEAGKIELVSDKMSVSVVIQETLSLINEKAMKHNVLLKTEFDPQIEFIQADKQRFKQILFNLLSNAVKFSKETGGTITITAKKEGDMVKISVSDTGIGIKDENIGRLFQKFEQLESGISQKYGGTGLGLAITKQLVELHGGKVWAESQFGEGTTFTFLLPILAKISENK